MSTHAQIDANRRNARFSTGPKTAEGKQAIARNNFRHGLTGAFFFLHWETPEKFDALLSAVLAEHKPQTPTEQILVERMAQHEWLRQRAHFLQKLCYTQSGFVDPTEEKQFALYLRYQTTHERGFHRCLNELLRLRSEKRRERLDEAASLSEPKTQAKPGFESQTAKAQAGPESSAPSNQPLESAAEVFYGRPRSHDRAPEPVFERIPAVPPAHPPRVR